MEVIDEDAGPDAEVFGLRYFAGNPAPTDAD